MENIIIFNESSGGIDWEDLRERYIIQKLSDSLESSETNNEKGFNKRRRLLSKNLVKSKSNIQRARERLMYYKKKKVKKSKAKGRGKGKYKKKKCIKRYKGKYGSYLYRRAYGDDERALKKKKKKKKKKKSKAKGKGKGSLQFTHSPTKRHPRTHSPTKRHPNTSAPTKMRYHTSAPTHSGPTYGKGKGKYGYPYCDEPVSTPTASPNAPTTSPTKKDKPPSVPTKAPTDPKGTPTKTPTEAPNPKDTPTKNPTIGPTSSPTEFSIYDKGNCPDSGSEGLPCSEGTNIRRVCNRYDKEFGSFRKCWEICEPSYCCIHDADPLQNDVAPSCSRDENCAQYAYCYIVWYKFASTFGPATYLNVEQKGAEYFFDVPNSEVRGDKLGAEFFDQLYFHHFDNIDAVFAAGLGTDGNFDYAKIFEDPDYWDSVI